MPEISAIRSPAVEDLMTPPVADPRFTRTAENQHIREEDAFRQRIESILDTGLRPMPEAPRRSAAEIVEEARAAEPTPAQRQQEGQATEAELEAKPLERPFEGKGLLGRGERDGLLRDIVEQVNGRFEQFDIPIGFEAENQTSGNGTSFMLKDLTSEEEITRVNTNQLLSIQRQIEDALSIPGTSELPSGLLLNRVFL